jgi:hypothetical protein
MCSHKWTAALALVVLFALPSTTANAQGIIGNANSVKTQAEGSMAPSASTSKSHRVCAEARPPSVRKQGLANLRRRLILPSFGAGGSGQLQHGGTLAPRMAMDCIDVR